MSDKVLVVMSGGLDSTTLAYDLEHRGYEVSTVTFDYGQRHGQKEIRCAQLHSAGNGWNNQLVDMSFIGQILESSLTGHSDVPEGHYAAENMKATIVPNRNAIMMSIATGIAVSRDIPYIATAVHGGDHFIYPDCRPEFINELSHAFTLGNEGFKHILAPYARYDKNFIAQRAVDLDYNWRGTWSCYKGGAVHCGKCGTCVERMEALWSSTAGSELEGIDRIGYLFPPSEYEDSTYWMKALEDAK
jgi:7-cyano-7-deazaguanine synthase